MPRTSIFRILETSAQVTTDANVTAATFTTFPNSPAFSFTPGVSGIYKISATLPIEISTGGTARAANLRIFNTSGGATLLQETQGFQFCITGLTLDVSSPTIFSTYRLTAGVTYVFDIQGKITGNTLTLAGSAGAPFFMFAENVTP